MRKKKQTVFRYYIPNKDKNGDNFEHTLSWVKDFELEEILIAAIYDPKALSYDFPKYRYKENNRIYDSYSKYEIAKQFIDDINNLLVIQRKVNNRSLITPVKYKTLWYLRKNQNTYSVIQCSKELLDKYKSLKKEFEKKYGRIFLITVERVILKDSLYYCDRYQPRIFPSSFAGL